MYTIEFDNTYMYYNNFLGINNVVYNSYMYYNSFPGINNVVYNYGGYEIRMC